jgi:hypothetical protein
MTIIKLYKNYFKVHIKGIDNIRETNQLNQTSNSLCYFNEQTAFRIVR